MTILFPSMIVDILINSDLQPPKFFRHYQATAVPFDWGLTSNRLIQNMGLTAPLSSCPINNPVGPSVHPSHSTKTKQTNPYEQDGFAPEAISTDTASSWCWIYGLPIMAHTMICIMLLSLKQSLSDWFSIKLLFFKDKGGWESVYL